MSISNLTLNRRRFYFTRGSKKIRKPKKNYYDYYFYFMFSYKKLLEFFFCSKILMNLILCTRLGNVELRRSLRIGIDFSFLKFQRSARYIWPCFYFLFLSSRCARVYRLHLWFSCNCIENDEYTSSYSTAAGLCWTAFGFIRPESALYTYVLCTYFSRNTIAREMILRVLWTCRTAAVIKFLVAATCVVCAFTVTREN